MYRRGERCSINSGPASCRIWSRRPRDWRSHVDLTRAETIEGQILQQIQCQPEGTLATGCAAA